MRFELIYCDPPWQFKSNSKDNPGRNVQKHYDTMSIKELRLMPIESIAEEDSMIAMWVTGPILDQAIGLMRAWGFKYKGILFTWVKTRKNGSLHKGLGYTTRKNSEICIYGTKGRGLGIPVTRNVEEIIISQLREHSKKPIEAYERLEELYPAVTRVELFARNFRDRWISFGNELPENVPNGKRTIRGLLNMNARKEYFVVPNKEMSGFY